MSSNRSGGILLHPTCLPGPDGIGDLGPEAYRWVNFLEEAGISHWQILPLGPTGYGDSPYQSFSAFAGNPYLISPALLLDRGLLSPKDLSNRPEFPSRYVDYGPVIQWKLTVLNRSFAHFKQSDTPQLKNKFERFQEHHTSWLKDFALFMAIKESQGGVSWNNWPTPLRKRDPKALQQFAVEYASDIQSHAFRQFLFFEQLGSLQEYIHQRKIKIIGDAPIFVAFDSADVWAHPELFFLDPNGNPTVVAGVPPDYFSPTGQLWGNPLYRWDIHADTGYGWWIERLRATLAMVDVVRLDHFRGFSGYWEVPFGKPTAEIGRWVPGPGEHFFAAVQQAFPSLPIIAEDLGVITPDVIALRERFNLPGMKIFQFAFSTDPNDPFLPHNYPVNCVAYTGTHDNDTTLGWYLTLPEDERDFVRRYLSVSGEDIVWDMVRALWRSSAALTLAPMQDLLSLDSSARMNFPGKPSGNWQWRIDPHSLSPQLSARIREMNWLYGRLPEYPQRKKTRY